MTDEAIAPGSPALSRWADALTIGRFFLAVPLGFAAFNGNWTLSPLLLSLSWWSDFFDGRLARRGSGVTRYGHLDLVADTVVGAGLLIGLVLGGHLSIWLGVAGVVLALGAAALRNPSLAMLLQAIAYAPALWLAALDNPSAFGIAVATIAAIALIDRRRLFGYVLPTFFRGLVGRHDRPG